MSISMVSEGVSISSLEIASLVSKEHFHVMRDIRELIPSLEVHPGLDWRIVSESFLDSQGKSRNSFRLGKNAALVLISKYSLDTRIALVKRLEDLETAINKGLKAYLRAEEMFVSRVNVLVAAGIPSHLARNTAVEQLKVSVGVDFSSFIQDALPLLDKAKEKRYLAPTDLASFLGFSSAKEMNRVLEELDLQTKEGSLWVATDRAGPFVKAKRWVTKFKSGVHLTWDAEAIRNLLVAKGILPKSVEKDDANSDLVGRVDVFDLLALKNVS